MPEKVKKFLKRALRSLSDGCLAAFEPDNVEAKNEEKSVNEPSRGISVLDEMIRRNNVLDPEYVESRRSGNKPSRGISVLDDMIKRNIVPDGLHRSKTVPVGQIVVENEEESKRRACLDHTGGKSVLTDDSRPGIINRRHTEEYKQHRRRRPTHPREESKNRSPPPPVPRIPEKFLVRQSPILIMLN